MKNLAYLYTSNSHLIHATQDGGLTALIPHLIRKSKEWRDARIEFYGLSKGDGSQQATVRMAAAQARLGHLINKIRIDADYRTIDANLAEAPAYSLLKRYSDLAKQLDFESELPEGWDDTATLFEPNRASRMLRLSELIAQFSGGVDSPASLVFIMLPVPMRGGDPRAYMAILSLLSDRIKCPSIFIRGNHQDVLTLYS